MSQGALFPSLRASFLVWEEDMKGLMVRAWPSRGTETSLRRRAATSAHWRCCGRCWSGCRLRRSSIEHLPADPQAEFDHGRVLSLLIAARLYSPVALMNVGCWAADSGADILWDIPVEKLNDDRLGRSVAAFFSQRHSILASVALHVSHEFGVPLSELHYDPTHLLLHGAYEGSEPRGALQVGEEVRSDGRLPAAHITQGRPMADVPQGRRSCSTPDCVPSSMSGGRCRSSATRSAATRTDTPPWPNNWPCCANTFALPS